MTRNFTLDELIASQTAWDLNINNMPKEGEIQNLRILAETVLQPLRNIVGMPIRVTSGYRCEELNSAVGGSLTSYHRFGYAADLVGLDGLTNANIFYTIKYMLPFTELIWEFGTTLEPSWVHVALDLNEINNQVKRAVKTEDGGTHYLSF